MGGDSQNDSKTKIGKAVISGIDRIYEKFDSFSFEFLVYLRVVDSNLVD